jgi:hypothetical protein
MDLSIGSMGKMVRSSEKRIFTGILEKDNEEESRAVD